MVVRTLQPMAEEDNYGEGVAYWDARYTNEPKPSDWILKYAVLQDHLERLLGSTRGARILHVGCGNSLLTEEMFDSGFKASVNIDISAVVVEQMRQRNAELRPEMEWLVMDATSTSFEDGHFDVVLDKCLIDTLLCEDDEDALIARYFSEMSRVMADAGLGIFITFGPPDSRLHRFPTYFSVEVIEIPAKGKNKLTGYHYMYVCRKAAPSSPGPGQPALSPPGSAEESGPSLSSRMVLSSDPLIVLVPDFLSPAGCAALRRMCFAPGDDPEVDDASVMLDPRSPILSDSERGLVSAVNAAIDELVGQAVGGDLMPMLVRPHEAGSPLLPAGLHVDTNGNCPHRFAAALVYLTTPDGGQTVFPLAVPSGAAEDGLGAGRRGVQPVRVGPAPAAEAVEAGRQLVESGILHTRHAKMPEEKALADQVLAEGEAGAGVAVAATAGSLVVFWCRGVDGGGGVDPRSWHSGARVEPGGEPKLVLRSFMKMPWDVIDGGEESIAEFVRATRAPHAELRTREAGAEL